MRLVYTAHAFDRSRTKRAPRFGELHVVASEIIEDDCAGKITVRRRLKGAYDVVLVLKLIDSATALVLTTWMNLKTDNYTR